MTHIFNPTILREYDVRGIVGNTLTRDDAYALGRGYSALARDEGARRIAVGRDGRSHSPELEGALIDGLTKGGLDVVRVGMGPSPMLYFATATLGVDGGIQVTGSHNPPDYNGFKMLLNGRSLFGTEIQALGRRGLAVQADAKEQEGAEALVKAVLEAYGKVDILVNNAGITRDDLIMRMKKEDWTDVLETNLFGAFWALKACTRPMLKARSGRVINITSVSGQAGQMGQANYSSAKAGLIGLTKASARELASRGITVNAVAPGVIETDMSTAIIAERGEQIRATTPLGRIGQPDDIAGIVAFLVSDDSRWITGRTILADGGLN